MIRYYTAQEISSMWRKPVGTVHRLAHEHQWPRAQDRRRPALYQADAVDNTMRNLYAHQEQPA